MHFLATAFLSAILSLQVSAILIAPSPTPNSTELWTIPDLATHFMGANSGLPGGWPTNTGFNSTVSFTLNLALNTSTQCSTNWTQPFYPTAYIPCTDLVSQFQLQNTPDRNFSEGDFVLNVKAPGMHSSFRTNITFTASVHVSSDNLADPSSYLTCLGGAPLSGIHCAMNGMISVPGPIKLLAVANATSAKT
ncbi:hypothetical protein K432DRAFT_405291 [Lepidopterella palustris CBS 459.81]|uniref:Ubiquitin 3 binding protein But2 C-terminal domain-containing protein n=1 Tax=Lepidopterella palustris CBS 459.81 TaxID=1314670 RepID=A0A8E2E9H5_9PEZI|nr:hypothetical protein K432DRAFT_405291 [Lepidopterella palustris CBS 459.81]